MGNNRELVAAECLAWVKDCGKGPETMTVDEALRTAGLVDRLTALLDAKDEESRRAGERAFEMHATLQGKLDLTEAEVLRLIRMGNEKICDALSGKCPSLLSSELFEELQDREVKGEPAAAYRCTNCNYLLDPSDVKVLTRYVSGGIPKGELWHCNVYFPCRPLYLRPDPLGLAAENLSLRAALAEARESIEGWAEYASEYFKDRWDLEGDLARVDAVLASTSPAAQAVLEVARSAVRSRAADLALSERINVPDDEQPSAKEFGDLAANRMAAWKAEEIAVDRLRTNFPTLAAGLGEEP